MNGLIEQQRYLISWFTVTPFLRLSAQGWLTRLRADIVAEIFFDLKIDPKHFHSQRVFNPESVCSNLAYCKTRNLN